MIIGLTASKRSGKDTLADYLVKEHGYIKMSFAEPLKEICRILFDFTDEQLHGDKKEEIDEYWKVTPRKVLQFIGTDLLRDQLSNIMPDIGNNIWLEIMKKKILKNPNQKIVIADLRFNNEIEFIKELGGIIIRINRTNNNNDNHESEKLINTFNVDYELNNNGTKEDLYKQMFNIIN